MKPLIVYSSRTGNTRRVAEAIHGLDPQRSDLVAVEEAPDPEGRPLVIVGFWVDRGMPDALSRIFLSCLKDQRVGLFATLGAKPDSDHAKQCMQRTAEDLEARGNTVACRFMCQGRVDPGLAAAMRKHHPPTPERLARLREAERHPDEGDLQDARDAFRPHLAGPGSPTTDPERTPSPPSLQDHGGAR